MPLPTAAEKHHPGRSCNTTTLRNSFTGQVTTGEERQHLLIFRTVGQEEYNNHVRSSYNNSTNIRAVPRATEGSL